MANSLKIKVNGLAHGVTASLDTPLLYVLHNELHLHGPRFGCGLAQCGACSVLLDGKEIRSCVTPVAAVSRQGDHDARGPAGSVGEGARHDGGGAGAASVAAGVDRRSGAALRLLPERDDDPGRRSARDDEEPDRGSDPHGDERPSLPLWHLSAHPDGDQAGRRCDGEGRAVAMTGFLHEKEFSRKSFVKGGGALVVGFSARRLGARRQGVGAPRRPRRATCPTSTQVDSWITITPTTRVDAQDEPDRDRQRHHDRLPAGRSPKSSTWTCRRCTTAGSTTRTATRRRHVDRRQHRRRGRLERDVGHRPEDPQRRRARARRRCSAWPRRSSAFRSRA